MKNNNIRLSLFLDADLCIGCFACEIACKQEHNLPVGRRWIKVFKLGPKKVGGKLYMQFVPVHCRHCGKPACMETCPVGAISKRSDGIVLFNEERCIGCKMCLEVCPFGALQYNPEKEVVEGCNLCVERVDRGLRPICVQNCPTGALGFGDINNFLLERHKRGIKRLIEREEFI